MSLSFAVDPIRCLERVYRRHGPVVRLEYGGGGRKPVLALVGPGYNREVLLATDRLRPTGIWPVRAPEGSAQANLRLARHRVDRGHGGAHHVLVTTKIGR